MFAETQRLKEIRRKHPDTWRKDLNRYLSPRQRLCDAIGMPSRIIYVDLSYGMLNPKVRL